MRKHLARMMIYVAIALGLLAMPSIAAAAPSPWWQIISGSRPTNLWIPANQVQEINAPSTPFLLQVGGAPAGGFNVPPFFPEATAENVQIALENVYGTGNVEVTGGPGGTAPFIVTSIGEDAGRAVAPIEIISPLQPGSTQVITTGGSGRLVVAVTNLGDAPADGSSTPVTIVDELPEGVEATDVEAVAGVRGDGGPGDAGPVACELEGPDRVSCSFEDQLPSYESIEVEILARLTGEPPIAGAPGKVTVSGGGASPVSAVQAIKVSPQKTPFGIEHFSSRLEEEGGGPSTRAGRHPFQITTSIQFNAGPMKPAAKRRESSVEQPAQPRNLRFPLPAGLVGNVTAVPTCDLDLFNNGVGTTNGCPPESAIGALSVSIVEEVNLGFARLAVPVFNLPPGPGEPARFGFTVAGVSVIIDLAVDPDNQYRVLASVENTSQVGQILSSTLTLWGAPGDPRHDSARGWACVYNAQDLGPCEAPTGLANDAFLRQPVSCVTPLNFRAEIEPWNTPLGSVVEKANSNSGTLNSCNQIPFIPKVTALPSNGFAGGASGLSFELQMPNSGLLDPNAISEGQAKKVEVTLPTGMTINPSQAEGLAACTPAQYAQETASSSPGAGCPQASKIGSVRVTTPLLEEEAEGSVYVAEPYDNPFDSLVALYMVAKIPERGVLIKQAGRVELDPVTGQIVSTFDDLPQIPFETFDLNFFAGARAPLVMPPKCGDYEIVARFTPWHASDPDNPLPSEITERTSSFTVDRGLNGGPCPSGTPPFKPEFTAGTTNNTAGGYSPFNIRLTREDGEGEFSRFSVKLPKGVIGKLAGIPFCSEASIAAARARTGPHGGQEELESPSCPAASQLGRTLVGAGVGPELTYAPGKIYLAGPYQGAKLSIVAIATAKVGPFDLGNVVIRQALRVNPVTAEVTSDGSSSDPIPHILQGIVVHARDIRVFIDRANFVLNPTNCERMSVAATVISGESQSADVTSPFQAADCASLGFKPKLSIQLLGGTKRTATPRLKAVMTARPGDANIGRAQVTLPKSEFLEQAHIRTVCTRVQFNAGGGNGEQCPKGSIYGKAKATSPLLDETLKGPVFLRSSNHELPDLVAALHSAKVDINLLGRIDSVGGGIRSTFEGVPDAPVTKFVLEMQGGKKGLIVNSTNICKRKHRATAKLIGQNGRRYEFNPVVKAKCGGKKKNRSAKRR